MSTTNRSLSFVLRIALAFVLIVVFSLPAVTSAEAVGTILFVAPNGLTVGSCASWASACDLQYALSQAASGSALWVKRGTYLPTNSTDRTVSFALKNGVGLYGGFAGTETDLPQRNPAANVTILSGDIGALNNPDDNSYHVVTGGGTNNTAILDGFTVRAGNANGSDAYSGGGGMYNLSGSPTLTNVTFRSNSANHGGGIYNHDNSNPTLANVTFHGNSATSGNGGGLLNSYSSPRLKDVTFNGNSATYGDGGGMYIVFGNTVLTNVTFSGNLATYGGGMINDTSSATLTNVTFSSNSATYGGGMVNAGGSSLSLTNVTFSSNSATFGGGLYNLSGSPTLTNVTFNGNSAPSGKGGGMFNAGTPTLTNVTFSANSATSGGGMYNRDSNGDATLTNATFHGNSATSGGGMFNESYSYPAIRNSILYGDTGGEIVSLPGWPGNGPIVSYSDVQGGFPGIGNIDADPLLGPLGDNGGFTQTMALGDGSPAIDAAEDATCPAQDQRGVTRPQGSHCDMGAYEAGDIKVIVGGGEVGAYTLGPTASTRQSYANVNSGPVKIVNTKGVPLIAAQRVIYRVNHVDTSFSEMMALPDSQLDTTYWLPWYNNVELDTQLRFANVNGSTATIHVYIGGVEMQGSPFMLLAGQSTRRSFAGINAGPVQIVSDHGVPIVAAERLIYRVDNVATSFSEMMALPNKALDSIYWLPWYNNVELDTQLRFANITDQTATVHVYVGGDEMPGSPFTLLPGESTRKSFAGINNGPVQIVSNVSIVAAERLIYKVNNVNTSFSEMMALPNSQLDTTYWLPWYNNVELDTQLRFANVTDQTATVHVYIGGNEMMGSPFTLLPGESTRKSFAGVNSGPVQIVSNVPIVAAERLIYKVGGVNTSFSEMMALPASQLDTTYWLPWYNNVDLDTQLRFGVP